MSKIIIVMLVLVPLGCTVFTEELMVGSHVKGNACCKADENNVNSRNGQAESMTTSVTASPSPSPSASVSPTPSATPNPSATPKV